MDRLIKVVVDTLNDVLDGIESSKCDISSESLDLLITLNDRIAAYIGKEQGRRVLQQAKDVTEQPIAHIRWGKLY